VSSWTSIGVRICIWQSWPNFSWYVRGDGSAAQKRVEVDVLPIEVFVLEWIFFPRRAVLARRSPGRWCTRTPIGVLSRTPEDKADRWFGGSVRRRAG
jgi:hypothetical protein